ncbi:hypothetical protein BVG19_g5032 [[Candida] boidinii]|nr:hypothetical protein BVG19_g5032 [[Candida] boidinii]OWB48611.1 hypothetical protein B5S27_g146 [[Candida] boidinii]
MYSVTQTHPTSYVTYKNNMSDKEGEKFKFLEESESSDFKQIIDTINTRVLQKLRNEGNGLSFFDLNYLKEFQNQLLNNNSPQKHTVLWTLALDHISTTIINNQFAYGEGGPLLTTEIASFYIHIILRYFDKCNLHLIYGILKDELLTSFNNILSCISQLSLRCGEVLVMRAFLDLHQRYVNLVQYELKNDSLIYLICSLVDMLFKNNEYDAIVSLVNEKKIDKFKSIDSNSLTKLSVHKFFVQLGKSFLNKLQGERSLEFSKIALNLPISDISHDELLDTITLYMMSLLLTNDTQVTNNDMIQKFCHLLSHKNSPAIGVGAMPGSGHQSSTSQSDVTLQGSRSVAAMHQNMVMSNFKSGTLSSSANNSFYNSLDGYWYFDLAQAYQSSNFDEVVRILFANVFESLKQRRASISSLHSSLDSRRGSVAFSLSSLPEDADESVNIQRNTTERKEATPEVEITINDIFPMVFLHIIENLRFIKIAKALLKFSSIKLSLFAERYDPVNSSNIKVLNSIYNSVDLECAPDLLNFLRDFNKKESVFNIEVGFYEENNEIFLSTVHTSKSRRISANSLASNSANLIKTSKTIDDLILKSQRYLRSVVISRAMADNEDSACTSIDSSDTEVSATAMSTMSK